MGIRDLLHRKDRLYEHDTDADTVNRLASGAPEFTFIRSDTTTQEVVHPPSFGSGSGALSPLTTSDGFLSTGNNQQRSRSNSASSFHSFASSGSGGDRHSREHIHRRLSQRLGLRRGPPSSENVPADLPEIRISNRVGADEKLDPETEAQWEKRATLLAASRGDGGGGGGGGSGGTAHAPSSPSSPISPLSPVSPFMPGGSGDLRIGGDSLPSPRHETRRASDVGRAPPSPSRPTHPAVAARPASPSHPDHPPAVVSTKLIDDGIQEAIRLHEEGELVRSTRVFARLADPNGANNPLSQVLYGLALRHGWGCEPDPAGAIRFLSAAASNAAMVEQLALQAGLKKGGAAKGELVLAIFELANCFRHGWGIDQDPVAAKQYYETAANLGDTDAMNEIGWCYLEGFGCKKDKFAAARYYRLAEKNGSKTLGNTWIWKDKYEPGYDGKKKRK